MNVSFVLWLAYHGLALCLCGWALSTALWRVAEHRTAHRAATLLAAIAAPAALACATLGPLSGQPELRAVGVLLPMAAFAAAWSNVMTLRDQGLGLKLLHAPVLVWNTALVVVYAARTAQEFLGTDLGTPGTALVAGHAVLQTSVGSADAMSRPFFLHLPLCLPLCLRYRWPQRLALSGAAGTATAMVWLLASAMPIAHDRVRQLREHGPEHIANAVDLGVVVRWAETGPDETVRAGWRSSWLGLGARVLAFDVDRSLFDDPQRLARTREEVAFARDQGRETIAIVRPDRQLHRRPVADLDALGTEITKASWLCAEQIEPDILVLYAGPYGTLQSCRTEVGTIDQWFDRIARDARDVRRANREIRLAVVLETWTRHAGHLFARLCADDSPVDLVGLSIDADPLTPHDVHVALDAWSAWILAAPGTRPIIVIDSGLSSISGGGEIAQWNVLGRLLAFASRHPRVTALIVDELADCGSGRGLTTPEGRTRIAWRRLRDIALDSAPRPPR